MRLAEASRMSWAELSGLVEFGQLSTGRDEGEAAYLRDCCINESDSRAFIRRRSRFCPGCLLDRPRWRLGWELLFADACSECGRWLLDTCPSCEEPLSWRRDALLRCPCSGSLCVGTNHAAPPAVAALSRALERIGAGELPTEGSCLAGLSIVQSVQLVRLLGTYGNWRGERMPQKVVDADVLSVSWPISTTAAEIIATWPVGFERLLDQLRSRSKPDGAGRLGRAFGGFYSALYRGLKGVEFDFVRRAFENYIARAWTGTMGRRNRRIDEEILSRMEWIPAAIACRLAGISARRLRRLVDSGSVSADRRLGLSGREYLMVRRDDMNRLAAQSEGDVTLTMAAAALGLKRRRLSILLPALSPAADRLSAGASSWVIPRKWLDWWIGRLAGLPSLLQVDSSTQVSLDTVLRYWSLEDSEVAMIFKSVQCDELAPVGALTSLRGVGSMVFPADVLRSLLATGRSTHRGHVTVPEVAERLDVKQEVAYQTMPGLRRSIPLAPASARPKLLLAA